MFTIPQATHNLWKHILPNAIFVFIIPQTTYNLWKHRLQNAMFVFIIPQTAHNLWEQTAKCNVSVHNSTNCAHLWKHRSTCHTVIYKSYHNARMLLLVTGVKHIHEHCRGCNLISLRHLIFADDSQFLDGQRCSLQKFSQRASSDSCVR